MANPLEIEIKLVASSRMLAKLRQHPRLAGEDRTADLVTTYFDTGDTRLRQGGATLRVRDSDGNREQTLKLVSAQGSMVRRHEWNVPLAGELPQPETLPVKAASVLAQLLGGAPLLLVALTRFQRTTRRRLSGESALEIAFDLGTIEAGGRRQAVCELELELVEGRLVDVIALALQLPLGPELRWSVRSKAERCHALAHRLPAAATPAQPVKLSPAMDVARGFQTVAWNALEHLLANYPLVITSGDPEGVHQTRVAIRRLRAAFTLFDDIARDETGPVLEAEFKAVALALGPVRDLDILVQRVTVAVKAGDDDLQEMLGQLALQRSKAVAAARKLLAARSFQRLLFEFAAWLEDGAWLHRAAATGGDQPLRPFAVAVLSRRRRKLRQMGKKLAARPATDLHRLRIEAKKLRYAAGFFASLFGKRDTARDRACFDSALRQLQYSLGELNDMAVATAGRKDLFGDLEAITAARYAAQLEGLLAAQEASRRKFSKQADKALAGVTGSPAWWKSGKD